jgi:glycerophosphoryl diester phosphodiesterase
MKKLTLRFMKSTLFSGVCMALLLVGCSSSTIKYDIQGHRGARGLAPENTLPSFFTALDYGSKTLELDVVISSDEQIVVSHEPWFNAVFTTKPDGTPLDTSEVKVYNFFEMTLDSIQQFDVGLRKNAHYPEQIPQAAYKPSLAQVVQQSDEYAKKTKREVPFYNIELKSSSAWYGKKVPQPQRFVELVLNEINRLGIQNRCNVQSFDLEILKQVKQQSPQIRMAVLVDRNQTPEFIEQKLGFLPEIWSPYYTQLSDSLILSLHEKGRKVIPWTVNDTSAMKSLLLSGVDGIITDYPNRLQEILRTK